MSAFQSSTQSLQGQAAPSRQFAAYNPVAAATAPAGTFLPGTKVQVGEHRVVVDKYLSEGGFAHVYVVRLPQPIHGSETAVLKRVAVPDKSALASMRTEVETMKKLKGHRHIVKYIDSHASQLRGGGYEVFLLMEYCGGGGLIDFMNTRLQNRLTEPEIIKIFSDVAEGARPAINCATLDQLPPPRPAATSAAEGRLIEDDVQRHTTLQYRSPEMIDVYRKQPIDEKSDIWALGVFLYKLCYYTTPFEEVGQMAILNASFKYPAYPQFSDRLKLFIASMLRELPQKRPNIYQVVQEICKMQGKEVPIRDSPPAVGAKFSPPMQETQIIPEIAPMRRGRPGKPQSSQYDSAKASPSPYRGESDPFATLDAGSRNKKIAEDMSNRFPSLEQFDILHEKGDKFDFEPTPEEPASVEEDLSQRLTNALADDAFARRASPERPVTASNRRSQASPIRTPTQEVTNRQSTPLYQPTPQRPAMVSTGTMTSPAQTPRLPDPKLSSRPIYRFPVSDEQRPTSQPWIQEEEKKAPSPPSSSLRPEASPRLSSDRLSYHSNSARPSMEALRRPSTLDVQKPAARSRSAIGKARPVSVQSSSRPHDFEPSRSSLDLSRYEGGAPLRSVRTELDRDYDQANISSDMDYLRAKEEEESNRKREKRSSTGAKHSKRGSLSTLSFSGGKNLFAGRFGDAFRRFEGGNQDKPGTPVEENLPQPQTISSESLDSPSEGFSPYHDDPLDDLERDDISPEMRRELERRRLSQEEKRVANAAAEYRRRVAEDGSGRAGNDGSRSKAILNRVQTLLGETQKPAVPKTATGYGKYTDTTALQAKQDLVQPSATSPLPISRTPGPIYGSREAPVVVAPPDRREGASAPAGLPQSASSSARPVPSRPAAPTAPP
ncbi:uncharacterized protein N7483_010869 [Penicillium malachiteum]|uniref:uncharacterized protein n=1 Tax=Penicillium malachiteum TaxID=1324776 RepID=UPI0025467B30|nr:uncharacterized protein N7483_010869 [Penicillium malachiteum]KAJ5713688.1 hypothetical protein N7483_010869 [Penicillium malachiteum]